MKRRLMWFDAEANLQELSSVDGLKENIENCKNIGIDTVIIDVKPLSGHVLYNSKLASKIPNYPHNYDLLENAIKIGHEQDLKVYAAINVFSEGSHIEPGGAAFEHPDWQCIQLISSNREFYQKCGCHSEAKRRILKPKLKMFRFAQHDSKIKRLTRLTGQPLLKKTGELKNEHNAVFVSPHNNEVVEYELSIINEICSNYNIDGITLDRMRYPNLYTDFGLEARTAFEAEFGIVENFPNDVMLKLESGYQPGSRFGEWITFRAKTIKNFFESARETAKQANPSIDFGVYAGSWYPYYFDVGVNWGSTHIKPDYPWWQDNYEQTGYIEFADYICTGCYYPSVTKEDAIYAGLEPWRSVEDGINQSIYAVNNETPLFASIYVRDYKNNPQSLQKAFRLCLQKTNGCMLFDLVQVREYGVWDYLK